MKKSLFLLGVAAAVFSGCSNQEVTSVFTLKEQNHANFVPELCQLFARLSGR